MIRGVALNSAEPVKSYLAMMLGEYDHEVLSVLLLDSQNKLIEHVEMFQRTINSTAVYLR